MPFDDRLDEIEVQTGRALTNGSNLLRPNNPLTTGAKLGLMEHERVEIESDPHIEAKRLSLSARESYRVIANIAHIQSDVAAEACLEFGEQPRKARSRSPALRLICRRNRHEGQRPRLNLGKTQDWTSTGDAHINEAPNFIIGHGRRDQRRRFHAKNEISLGHDGMVVHPR